jgi:hypothetical protein
MFVVLVNDLSH